MTAEPNQDGASGDRGHSRADSNVTGNAHADGALLPPPLVLGAADDDGDDDDDADDSDSWLEPENRRANGGCGCNGEGACVEAGDDAWTEGGEQMGHFLNVQCTTQAGTRLSDRPFLAAGRACRALHTCAHALYNMRHAAAAGILGPCATTREPHSSGRPRC